MGGTGYKTAAATVGKPPIKLIMLPRIKIKHKTAQETKLRIA